MKRLLLLVNALAIVFIVASCCNVKKTETGNVAGKMKSETGVSLVSDTLKSNQSREISGSEGKNIGTKTDTMQLQGNGKAIIHHGPNEAKIDSIKNAKAKDKK
jgi:hypothetical protein